MSRRCELWLKGRALGGWRVRSWELGGRIRGRDEGILLERDGAILREYMTGASEVWTSIRLSRNEDAIGLIGSRDCQGCGGSRPMQEDLLRRFLLASCPRGVSGCWVTPFWRGFTNRNIISASSGHEVTVANVLGVVKNDAFIQIMSRLLHAL
jgi:hypothetical protein